MSLTAFEPNGLLGGDNPFETSMLLDATDGDEHNGDHGLGMSFTSNGLLDSLLKPNTPPVTVSPSVTDLADDEESDILAAAGSSSSFGAPLRFLSTLPLPDPQPASSGSQYHTRATTFDGRTVFIKRKLPKARKPSHPSSSHSRTSNLLDVPIHRMLEQLSQETAEKLQTLDRQPPKATTSQSTESTLWVDRYRPTKFTELMGNERVARETMSWVKQWDWCVFGKSKQKGKTKMNDPEHENHDPDDQYRRPKNRILLLSGPAGLGKTTMAHVVARQAGYQVMEINASDARSAQIVDDRIRPALESGSAVGSSKPVLLVIDEIDGATGGNENSSGFIQKLVQLTYDKPRKKNHSKDAPNSRPPLLRPIICICNDPNASALAKLRPIALQVRFQKPADVHTVRRLKEICLTENLKADSRALSALVSVSNGDLRGCLNTLQFVKARNEDVTEVIIRKATVGMKEGDTSLSAVVNSLFIPMSRKRVKDLGMKDEEDNRYVARLSREVDAAGKDNSVATACFAHYATLRQHDINFSRFEKAGEWLMTFDRFSAAMYTDGDFALAQYLPYTLVPFYPLFSERGGSKVERNQDDWENLQTTRTNEEIYKTLGKCLQAASTHRGGDYRHLVSTPILQLEFAPFINRIISPPLRPVNSQIIKPEERAVLMRLVSIMASLEIRFVQERGEDGQLTFRLDPPIDVFVTYDGKRATDLSVSRYAVRRLVAEEVDAELSARQLSIIDKGKRGKHDSLFGGASSSKKGSEDSSPGKKRAANSELENPSKRIKASDVVTDIADRPPVDFFGRLIVPKTKNKTDLALGGNPGREAREFKVLYKFAEGNSAAVRKPVKMDAFL